MPKKGHKWAKKQRLKRSQQYCGKGNPFHGKKHTEEVRNKIGQLRKGVWNGFGFKKGHIPWNKDLKGIHLSPKSEFKKGMRLPHESYRRGKNHPSWKGGVSGKYRQKYLEKLVGRIKPKKCEVCERKGKIYFDHDHKTKQFRGWICSNCNFILGHAQDDPKILMSLMRYLKKNGE